MGSVGLDMLCMFGICRVCIGCGFVVGCDYCVDQQCMILVVLVLVEYLKLQILVCGVVMLDECVFFVQIGFDVVQGKVVVLILFVIELDDFL